MLMNIELIVCPAIIQTTPIKKSQGDKAETNIFRSHKAGAGQRTRRKNVMLISAAKHPETAARI